MASKAPSISDAQFEEQVLKSSVPALVDFGGVGWGPCRMLAPTLDALAQDYAGKIKVFSCDIDQNPAAPARYGIAAVPTIILFKNGAPLETFVGVQPKADYAKAIDAAIA